MGIGYDGDCCRIELESSCVGRQGQAIGCKIYFVAYQNKRFNFTRQRDVGAVLLEYLVYRDEQNFFQMIFFVKSRFLCNFRTTNCFFKNYRNYVKSVKFQSFYRI